MESSHTPFLLDQPCLVALLPGFQVSGSPRIPAGYHYDAKLRIASAGLSPASTAASLAAPPLPSKVLDLPFVWRAMEWSKPEGQIAFALHARLLFQQGDGMPAARQALFDALDVTSVVNGGELRQTKVWPQISAPFCILFATNRTPGVEAGFRFINPRLENSLNNAGGMRIDTENAEVLPSRQLVDTPEILKILFRGSKADLGILERIRGAGHPTLDEFWEEKIGVTDNGHLLGSGNGYQKLRATSEVRRNGDGLPGVDASAFKGWPEITVASLRTICVDKDSLDTFSLDRVHRLRSPDLFARPLIVVHEAPPAERERMRVGISEENVVFNQTFHGYSPRGYAEASLLARYLVLVLGSKLTIWFALVTSGKFGCERDVVEKTTLDRISLPDFDRLTPQQREDVKDLVDGLQSQEISWEEVDEWVRRLYGLGQRDWEVISDTLELNLPFAENKRKAQAAPSADERQRFCDVLRDELQPWCNRFGAELSVDHMPPLPMSPWQAIAVRSGRRKPSEQVPPEDWDGLLRAADRACASEILVENGSGGLLIGRLAQMRYWSATQARLLAQRIAWAHIELLKGHAGA